MPGRKRCQRGPRTCRESPPRAVGRALPAEGALVRLATGLVDGAGSASASAAGTSVHSPESPLALASGEVRAATGRLARARTSSIGDTKREVRMAVSKKWAGPDKAPTIPCL